MTCKFMINEAISFIIKMVITKQYTLKLHAKKCIYFHGSEVYRYMMF